MVVEIHSPRESREPVHTASERPGPGRIEGRPSGQCQEGVSGGFANGGFGAKAKIANGHQRVSHDSDFDKKPIVGHGVSRRM